MEEANEKRLIIVKQLPEFEEHLHLIKEEAEKRVADAMQMVVSEETVKTVKKVRAELNSEFSALEQSRIAAKKAVMEPYEKLEAIYKTCVTDVYGPANEQLGSKIADVENGLKEAKKEKVKAYFEECCVAANIDWLKYEQAEIIVTLSASEKSLKEKAKSFVSRIASEIGLIETQEHADEIMVEYKQTLLLADSIRLIQRRYEALQKEKEKKERIAAEKALKAAAAAKVSAECAEQNPPQANPAPLAFKPPTETTVQQRMVCMDEGLEKQVEKYLGMSWVKRYYKSADIMDICLLWRKIKTVPMLESLIKTGWCNEFLKVFYGACRRTWLNLKSKTYYGVFGLNRQEMRIAGKTHDLQEVERAHSWKAAGLAITEENLKMVKKIWSPAEVQRLGKRFGTGKVLKYLRQCTRRNGGDADFGEIAGIYGASDGAGSKDSRTY